MTQLSRLATLGLAKESAPGVYATPTAFLPFQKCDYEDQITEIKDQSFRANDTLLQGVYAGPISADWSIDMLAYPDLTGHFLRGIIGPDVVSGGVATTLSAASQAGDTTISVGTTIPVGSYIQIGSGTTLEYAKVSAVTGSGPYTLTVTSSDAAAVGLTLPHASSSAVVAAYTHTFKQSSDPTTKATYSLTVYDTLDTRSYSDVVFSDLSIKIDPKGAVTLGSKAKSMPRVAAASMIPTYTTLAPVLGWEWIMTNAGAQSSRGLSYDIAIKRAVDVIHSSDGTQGPREIFQGAMDVTGTYKAIFENHNDLALYEQYLQQPASATLQQPIAGGGSALTLTMSKSAWTKGKRDWGDYVQADFSLAGIFNATDGGAISATLTNFLSAAY